MLLDSESGEVLGTYGGHAAEVARAAFVARDLVATSAWDGLTRFWSTESAELILEWPGITLPGAGGGTERIAARAGGRFVVHRLERSSVLRTLDGHEGKAPRGLACAPDGSWIATGAADGLRLWDAASCELRSHLDPSTTFLSLAPDATGRYLFASDGESVRRYDVAAAIAGRPTPPIVAVPGNVEDIATSSDGRLLAVMRPYDRVDVVDLEAEPPVTLRTLDGPGRIAGLAFAPGDSRLASGAWRGHGVRVWDASTGEVLLDRHPDERQATAAFDATGERLLVGMPDAFAAWPVEGGDAELRTRKSRRSFDSAGPIASDPRGRWISAVADRDTIELRDAATLDVRARLWADGTPLQALRFLPTTEGLVAATTDGRALVWDLGRLADELEAIGLGLRAR